MSRAVPLGALPAHLQAALRPPKHPCTRKRRTPNPPKAPKPKPVDPFPAVCTAAGLPAPVTEHRFHPSRQWRFDYAWPAHRIALEVEGGVWTGGRHTRGAGFLGDVEKYNAAAVLGWRVLRCTPRTLTSAATLALLHDALSVTPAA